MKDIIKKKIDIDKQIIVLEKKVEKFKQKESSFLEDFDDSVLGYIKSHMIEVTLSNMHKYISEDELKNIKVIDYQSTARIDQTPINLLKKSIKASVKAKKAVSVKHNGEYSSTFYPYILFKDNSSIVLFYRQVSIGDTDDIREITLKKKKNNLIEIFFTYKMVSNVDGQIVATKYYMFNVDYDQLNKSLNDKNIKYEYPDAPRIFPGMM